MIPVRVEKHRLVPSRWLNPLYDLDTAGDFENLVDRFFGGSNNGGWYPADIWEDADSLHIEVEIPGFKKDDVNLSYEDGILRIEAEKKGVPHEGESHLSERRYGKFVRAFQLPNVVDSDSIKASFTDGVLTVTLAKRAEAKPRKIAIETN